MIDSSRRASLYRLICGARTDLWAVEARDSGLFSASGRPGSRGHVRVKLCKSPAAAQAERERRVTKKLGEGFELVRDDFELGTRFPGNSRSSNPKEVLKELSTRAAGEVGQPLRHAIEAFCDVLIQPLMSWQRSWMYAWDLENWAEGAPSIVLKISVVYLPAGVHSNVHNEKELGWRIDVEAAGLQEEDIGLDVDARGEGSSQALWVMLDGRAFDLLRERETLSIEAFHCDAVPG